MIADAHRSAARLVNILTSDLPSCFADTHAYNGKPIHLHKRAQILVADLWACFNGTSYGAFDDIDTALTMFADYRVPQMLQRLGALWYSPRLEGRVRRGELLESGDPLEVEVRACSVWAVELLRREMARKGWDEWEAEVEMDEGDGDQQVQGIVTESDTVSRVVQADVSHTDNSTADECVPARPEDTDVARIEPLSVVDDPATTSSHDSSQIPPVDTEHPDPRNNDDVITETTDPIPSNTVESLQQQKARPPAPSQSAPKPKPKTTIRVKLNAILLDYLLYDVAKEQEQALLLEAQAAQKNGLEVGGGPDGSKVLPHHRTRSIWY
jgi:hypothetical protein